MVGYRWKRDAHGLIHPSRVTRLLNEGDVFVDECVGELSAVCSDPMYYVVVGDWDIDGATSRPGSGHC